MNILVLGDVVSQCGCEKIRAAVPGFKRLKNIDLCIANGENSAKGNGITPQSADFLFSSGVDFITTGNHAFRRAEMYDYFDESDFVIRPYNYPSGAAGKGYRHNRHGKNSGRSSQSFRNNVHGKP